MHTDTLQKGAHLVSMKYSSLLFLILSKCNIFPFLWQHLILVNGNWDCALLLKTCERPLSYSLQFKAKQLKFQGIHLSLDLCRLPRKVRVRDTAEHLNVLTVFLDLFCEKSRYRKGANSVTITVIFAITAQAPSQHSW